jgi:hypothetical protein
LKIWPRAKRPTASVEADSTAEFTPGAGAVTSPRSRAFLKALGALVGGAGVAQIAARSAGATRIDGTPTTTVDTNLTVQGNLVVTAPNRVGIGAPTPQGALDVAGEWTSPA